MRDLQCLYKYNRQAVKNLTVWRLWAVKRSFFVFLDASSKEWRLMQNQNINLAMNNLLTCNVLWERAKISHCLQAGRASLH